MVAKNQFWLVSGFLYALLLAVVKFGLVGIIDYGIALLISGMSIWTVKNYVLRQVIHMSIYTVRHPEDKFLRLLACSIAVFWLIAYPFLPI